MPWLLITIAEQPKETDLGMENWRGKRRPILGSFAITFPNTWFAHDNHHDQSEFYNYYQPIGHIN
jgi:hypothetical protein